MSRRETYLPGPAAGAQVEKDGERSILILVRELRHPPAKVWQALSGGWKRLVAEYARQFGTETSN